MKIRTDFVTNSSSSWSAEVVIDNPVLLEILQRYKDMGLLGDNDSIIGIGEYKSMDGNYSYPDRTKTPAFYYLENDRRYGYSNSTQIGRICYLDEVLENIISIMDSAREYLDDQLLPLLIEELEQRKNEIDHAYLGVHFATTYIGDDAPDSSMIFEYDPINGKSITNTSPFLDCQSIAEIIIENPILLEIPQRYKDMRLLGKNDSVLGIGEYKSMDKHFDENQYKDKTRTPAFFYFEEQVDDDLKSMRLLGPEFESPSSLDEVLEGVCQILDMARGYLNRQILPKLQEELHQRKDEINNAYINVLWTDGPLGAGLSCGKSEYDPVNGWRNSERNPDSEE